MAQVKERVRQPEVHAGTLVLALIIAHPDLSDETIAEVCDCSVEYVQSMPLLRKARSIAKALSRRKPK